MGYWKMMDYQKGDALIVESGATLPPYCVKTNMPVEQTEMIKETYFWTPNAQRISLTHALFGLAKGKRCELTFGIKRSVLIRYKLMIPLKAICCLLGLFLMLTGALMLSLPKSVDTLLTATGGILAIGCGFALPFGNHPLKVTDHDNGRFLIKGFSKEFLARFEEDAAV